MSMNTGDCVGGGEKPHVSEFAFPQVSESEYSATNYQRLVSPTGKTEPLSCPYVEACGFDSCRRTDWQLRSTPPCNGKWLVRASPSFLAHDWKPENNPCSPIWNLAQADSPLFPTPTRSSSTPLAPARGKHSTVTTKQVESLDAVLGSQTVPALSPTPGG